MSSEILKNIAENKASISLTNAQRDKFIKTGIRLTKSLPANKFVKSAVYGDPKIGSAWLVDTNIFNDNGIRINKFTAHDGSIEIITAIKSFQVNREVDGEIKRVTVPSQILWQDFSENNAPIEENTIFAAEKLITALNEIKLISGFE